MKIAFLVILILAACVPLVRFLLQRSREKKAQAQGLVLYATVISLTPVKVFGKPSPVMKILMWVQQPGGDRREVSLSSRIAAGQNVAPGVMLPIVVDPTDAKKVYPASPEAMKRVVLTGSREQRRMMKKQGM
jgi:hypothetical protein